MKATQKILTAAISGLFAGAISSSAFAAEKKAATPPKAEEAKGECHGINSCKGKGECGGKGHSCAGKNECKGKGWLSMTEKDCKAKKGTFKKG